MGKMWELVPPPVEGSEWRGGLMVGALDSRAGASGPGSSPGRGHCVVFLVRHFTLRVPLFTQVYKWVPANLMLGSDPAMD